MNRSCSNKNIVIAVGCLVIMLTSTLSNACWAQDNRYRPPAAQQLTPTQQPSVPSNTGQTAPATTVDAPADQQPIAVTELVNSQPVVLKAEAYAGQPYGVGKVTFRLSSSDKMLDRTGAILIEDAQQRILYPVVSSSAFKAFVESIVGKRNQEPTDVHTVWFLFQGEAPLTISVFGSQQTAINVPVEFVRPRQFDRRVKQWWQSFNRVVDEQIASGDYPPILHVYLKSLIGKRFGLTATDKRKKNRDPLLQTFQLMFDLESLRLDTITDLMTRGVQAQLVDQPVPAPINWTPVKVDNLPPKIKIEPMAHCVPEECFYLRFGTWGHQLWLKRLMEEFGGDLSRMIQARGFRYRIQSKFLDQLALENSGFDDLFGGRLIDDVAVIGMDTYFDSGSAVGVILHAKNSKTLDGNLRNKRAAFAKRHQKIGATIKEIKVDGNSIEFLSTPDNRYRSFYVVAKDCHLFTTSLTLAKRFLEASKDKGSLAKTEEFRFARYNMPLERDDTIFIFASTRFFQNLLTPQYQIELRRRNRIATDMILLELGKLAATNEGHGDMPIDQMVNFGYLPNNFGYRPDGGDFKIEGDQWRDSIRGLRGFFVPIPDLPLTTVTADEVQWFEERAAFFTDSIRSLDPMLVVLKRFELKDNVERVVFDARLAPFGAEKYGWLMSMLGPPLEKQVATPPSDIASFQASMKGGNMNPHVPPYQVFAGVQDYINPQIDMNPSSRMGLLRTLREIPGYLGTWPSPGYLNWMPALGGQPDEFGYTYSRLLKLWRLQWNSFSVLAFDQHRLENLKPHLKIVESERSAQIRLTVEDLSQSALKDWANTVNYRRAWQTSVSNIQMLNLAVQQFRISPEQASIVMQRMLDAELICSLGGEYQLAKTPSGRSIWVSSKWPSFLNPVLPPKHIAPFLAWFRGLEVQVSKAETQFSIHGFLDIQRSEQAAKLPSFKLFEGFGNLFGGQKGTENNNANPQSR